MNIPEGAVNPTFTGPVDELVVAVFGDGRKGFAVDRAGYADIIHHSTDCLEMNWHGDANSVFPAHWHTDTEEWIRVDLGELWVWVGNPEKPAEVAETILHKGDEITIPPGVAHMAWYPVETVVRLIWTPPARLVDASGKEVWFNV